VTEGVTIALRLGVLALIYLFLAALARIAWRDLTAAGAERRGNTGRAYLVVLDGAANGPHAGTRFAIEEAASIGRDPANNIAIDDRTVSARHAALVYEGGRWWVEDTGSTNGTFVNGARVDGPTPIAAGDVLQVGRVTLRLLA